MKKFLFGIVFLLIISGCSFENKMSDQTVAVDSKPIKKEEVIEAKTDTSKFEKLKEKKVEEYNKAAAKEEESFIEEFVIRGLGET